ncbi:MAG TPA: alpha/beta hydrolase [Porticoccus sp.]|nr:alpha/beta hydrolase [Porticoccus sp.]
MNPAIDFLIDHAKDKAIATVLLSHGAGAPMDTPFMQHISQNLAAENIQVIRFEFPYMAQRRTGGAKRPPNRQAELLACWQQAINDAAIIGPLFIGGKSMGGRMASLLLADDELRLSLKQTCAGLICLGYPFHPTNKPEKLRTEHLSKLNTQSLILQGSRDTLGNREEVDSYHLVNTIQTHWLEDGDHSFKPRKKSGRTLEQNMNEAVAVISSFIHSQLAKTTNL